MRQILIATYMLAALAATCPAYAEPPQIDSVSVRQSSDGTWRFDVTISHPDTGWEHYADGWRVLDMEGNELGMRMLHHPHVEEQPFTRSLSGVHIPKGTRQVRVQARDTPAGWNDGAVTVTLP